MTVSRRRLLWGIAAMVLAATTLALMLRPLRRERAFHVPDAREAAAAERFFAAALAAAPGGHRAGSMADQAGSFGLIARRLDQPSGLAIAEPEGECHGRGAYLLRDASDLAPVAVTAPHRGADKDTGPLAMRMFREFPMAAAAWNTAPRHGASRSCPEGGDVTRLPSHYFTAFALAFAHRYPRGRLVQLHGFEAARPGGSGARRADAIISDGSADPSPRLLDVADCLARRFPDRTFAVYPIDTGELGATTNAQGKALRAAGFAGFTHLEMSLAFRRHLLADADARRLLAQCLGAIP